MAKECFICSKKKVAGNQVSHSHRATRRTWGANLQKKSIEVDGKIITKEIELLKNGENEFEIEVSCSKGTYIRTLIDDMGQRLGCGAVMTKLERTAANGVSIADCLTLEELNALSEKGEIVASLHTVDRLLPYVPYSLSPTDDPSLQWSP